MYNFYISLTREKSTIIQPFYAKISEFMKSKSILKIENVHNCWNALKSNVRFKLLKGNNHNHLLIDKRDSKKKCKITTYEGKAFGKLLHPYIYMHSLSNTEEL